MFKPTKEESKAPFIPLFSLDLNFLLAAAPGGGTDAKNTQKSKLGRQLSLGCEQTTTASSEWAQVGALLVEAQTFPRGTGGKPPPLNFHSPHFPASLAHTLPPAPPPPSPGDHLLILSRWRDQLPKEVIAEQSPSSTLGAHLHLPPYKHQDGRGSSPQPCSGDLSGLTTPNGSWAPDRGSELGEGGAVAFSTEVWGLGLPLHVACSWTTGQSLCEAPGIAHCFCLYPLGPRGTQGSLLVPRVCEGRNGTEQSHLQACERTGRLWLTHRSVVPAFCGKDSTIFIHNPTLTKVFLDFRIGVRSLGVNTGKLFLAGGVEEGGQGVLS